MAIYAHAKEKKRKEEEEKNAIKKNTKIKSFVMKCEGEWKYLRKI